MSIANVEEYRSVFEITMAQLALEFQILKNEGERLAMQLISID